MFLTKDELKVERGGELRKGPNVSQKKQSFLCLIMCSHKERQTREKKIIPIDSDKQKCLEVMADSSAAQSISVLLSPPRNTWF